MPDRVQDKARNRHAGNLKLSPLQTFEQYLVLWVVPDTSQ